MKTLTLANLPHHHNGRVALAFDQLLKQAYADVKDRPAESAARKVTLTLMLTPQTEGEQGLIEGVGVQFKFDIKLPPKQTVVYPMAIAPNGALVFEPDSPGNPRQSSLLPQPGEDVPANVDPDTGEVMGE